MIEKIYIPGSFSDDELPSYQVAEKLNELIDAYNSHTHEVRESVGPGVIKTTLTTAPANTTKAEKEK